MMDESLQSAQKQAQAEINNFTIRPHSLPETLAIHEPLQSV